MIIDTGISRFYMKKGQALYRKVWINVKEGKKGKNRRDDDKNGLVDDFYGWNTVSNNNDMDDSHGHGTHIAGLVAKNTCKQLRIVFCKSWHPKMRNGILPVIKCLRLADQYNVDLINYSGGGPIFSSLEKKVIVDLQENNILLVAAAGNERSNLSKVGYYPASYDLSNIVAVGGVDKKGIKIKNSNYGPNRSWDIKNRLFWELGKSVVSLGLPFYLNGIRYGSKAKMTGTSQATAIFTNRLIRKRCKELRRKR